MGDNLEKFLSDKNDFLLFNFKGILLNRKDSYVLFYRCFVWNNDGVGFSFLVKLVILCKGMLRRFLSCVICWSLFIILYGDKIVFCVGYEVICVSEEFYGVMWLVMLVGMIDE